MRPPLWKTALATAACLAAAVVFAWSPPGQQLDQWAYDFWLRLRPPAAGPVSVVVVALDEETLRAYRGMPNLRRPLAEVLEAIAGVETRVVAVDIQLADGIDAELDARLGRALAAIPRVVLAATLVEDSRARTLAWEDPLPEFGRRAALGHVHADPDDDGVSRRVLLAQEAAGTRRWALALEALRLASGGAPVVESEETLEAGGRTIPAARRDRRALRIRYLPGGVVERISAKDLIERPALAAQLRDRAVFLGVTAQGGPDRLMTPYSQGVAMPGVEIHAHLYETMARGDFLADAPHTLAIALALGAAAAMGLAFHLLAGARAFALGLALLAAAHAAPYAFFARREVLPLAPLAAASWFCFLALGTRHYLLTRRKLTATEAQRDRYQRAVHYVTHEMRTPLTAIQGSSELMGRYPLTAEKRREVVGLIHSESRRLARMIDVFLSVERLSAGQLELKKEPLSAGELVAVCMDRARPLAEAKRIRLAQSGGEDEAVSIHGDREFLEYACYNLITNAIKYSPAGSEIVVSIDRAGQTVRVSVRDHGYGMDADEVRKIFQKFYRTRRAVESGEAGSGVGLALVEEIVVQHGGSIEVESRVEQGSRFTLVLPRASDRAAVARP